MTTTTTTPTDPPASVEDPVITLADVLAAIERDPGLWDEVRKCVLDDAWPWPPAPDAAPAPPPPSQPIPTPAVNE